ncbi:hypothetical protein [Paraburkholderia fungorum]|jgi:hypothetical protein|uniref:hypothetical protein n=1 Tax=Paraburkholderia fungorum TaxID=134537 RepID=UPI0006270D71|nr:hypothetical protein [Paraburkholderia fungorum]PZR43940.1 MAG: hypothetical protein DI523_25920 [Paraburkholderia fungorum]QLD48088.1 hypothetical protein C9419_03010 [Paraburkholderia fungorum]
MGGVFSDPEPGTLRHAGNTPVWPALLQHIDTTHRLDEPKAFLYISVNPYHSAATADFLPLAY